jgi:hypothetical protein
MRTAIALLIALSSLAALPVATEAQAPGAKKKIVFLAGRRSHAFGDHEHYAGCTLLARRLNDSNTGVEAVVVKDGWPKDESVLDGAAAVVMFSDGGGGHFAITKMKDLNALHDRGVGIGAIHYAVEVPRGKPGDNWLKWMGGYFEMNWSVNPHWRGNFTDIPKHPVANGVKPFSTQDEWYYNMRFREGMEGVTPILSAVPPDETRTKPIGPHSGNPEVRKGVGKNQKEHVLWVSENANGSRGFGTTGAHFHWNWAQDDWRKCVLNACLWVAKVDVPSNGVESKTPTIDELLENQDDPPPANFDKEKKAKEVAEMNKPREARAATK